MRGALTSRWIPRRRRWRSPWGDAEAAAAELEVPSEMSGQRSGPGGEAAARHYSWRVARVLNRSGSAASLFLTWASKGFLGRGEKGQASKAGFSDSTRRNGFNGFADSALSISILDTKNLICFFLKKQTKTKYEREKKHQELHRPATVGGPSGAPRAHETTATRACLEHPDRFVNKLCIHVFAEKS